MTGSPLHAALEQPTGARRESFPGRAGTSTGSPSRACDNPPHRTAHAGWPTIAANRNRAH
jgi:hypothetical protein